MSRLQGAAEKIQACHDAPAPKAKEIFGEAMVGVIRVRNERIRALSVADAARDGELRRLNAILSLMASIEFPLAGFHRDRLAEVTRELRSLHGEHA